MSNSITKHEAGLEIEDPSFALIDVPKFKFEQERWSTSRTENVEKIADTWKKNPTLVRIFQDNKFDDMEMALLRKDQLEGLIKTITDLRNSQAAVQYNFQSLFEAFEVVQSLVETNKQELPIQFGKPLVKSIGLMATLWTKMTTKLVVKAPTRQLKPSPLSEEEMMPPED